MKVRRCASPQGPRSLLDICGVVAILKCVIMRLITASLLFTTLCASPAFLGSLWVFFVEIKIKPEGVVDHGNYETEDYAMATSKTGGSTQNSRDSHSKRLGVKLFDGQHVRGGCIIVRQRGTHIHPGPGVGRGGDDTLFVKKQGILRFFRGRQGRHYVSVVQTP